MLFPDRKLELRYPPIPYGNKFGNIFSSRKISEPQFFHFPCSPKIDHLEKGHKKSPNWPTEINFALRNSPSGNISMIFFHHKILLDDWKHHMAYPLSPPILFYVKIHWKLKAKSQSLWSRKCFTRDSRTVKGHHLASSSFYSKVSSFFSPQFHSTVTHNT